eukprot:COSAG05_NODE_593_length_8488_cov_13.560367_2_plen_266_part_00
MSLAEELDLLRDVRRAAMRQAAVRLPESFDCELLQVAQQAAKNFYGTDELPVWAADVTLTAGHLARRRASMDPWAYAVIVRDMGRLYCHRKTAARAKTIELVVECRSDEHEWARAGLGSLQEDVRQAGMLLYPAKLPLELPVWGGLLLQVAQQAAQTVYGDKEDLPVWASDLELAASHLVRRRYSIDARVYAMIVRQMARRYYDHDKFDKAPNVVRAGIVAVTTDDEGSEGSDTTSVSEVFEGDEEPSPLGAESVSAVKAEVTRR